MERMGAIMPPEAAHHHWPAMPPPDMALTTGSFMTAHQRSVLICAGDISADVASPARLASLARAAGLRVLDSLPLSAAASQIDHRVALDAVILGCSALEAGAEALLMRLGAMAEAGHLAVIVITDLAGLDRVHGLLRSDRAVILCNPCAEDQVAAIAAIPALAEQPGTGDHLHDIGTEAEADRFERLNDQLLRLNKMVEALVQDRTPEDSYLRPWGEDGEGMLKSPSRRYQSEGQASAAVRYGPISAQQVRAMLRVRRLRDHLVAPDLFADPAWDILLDLLAARLENTQVSVSSLCIASAVPPTTALRWIRQLTDRGLLARQADPRDGRRIFITLSDEGVEAVTRWFHESRAHLQSALGVAEGR